MDQPSSPESNALTLRIKFKSASLEDFIGRYGVDVSPGGIFIRTKQPVDVGTSLQFDFTLADGSSLLCGLGTVAWVRENDPSRANNVPGMGLRFDKLTPESQQAHQTILAEKSRKDGKPQATPYPPTAFVAPAARPASAATGDTAAVPDTLPKAEPSPANFAKTLPAPAAALSARLQEGPPSARATDYSDEFDAGGKTEISDKPLDYFIQEAEAAQAKGASATAAVPDAAPKADIEEWKTDAHTEEGLDAAPPAPEEVALLDSQAYSAEVPSSEIPVPPPAIKDSGERRPSDKDFFTSMLDMGDTSENKDAKAPAAVVPTEDGSGVPIEEAAPEKTEEFSLAPTKTGEEAAKGGAPVDLGAGANEIEEQPVPSLGEIPFPETKKSAKRGTALMIAAVVVSGAAAFAAVYLLQTKPWQATSQGEEPDVVVKKVSPPAASPAPAPTPVPAARPAAAPPTEKAAGAAPAKVAVATERSADKQPAAPAEKPATEKEPQAKAEKPSAAEKAAAAKAEKAAAAQAAAEKAAAEKAEKAAAAQAAAEKAAAAKAEKAAAAKAAAERAAAAKAEKVAAAKAAAEKAAAEKAAAKTAKSSDKPAAKPIAAASPEAASAAKPAAAGEQEEIYRLAFRSSPIGAEVLIDGEYYARTPCERRILDPKKNIAITVRKEGYEPHERMIGPSDSWLKKEGGERVLSVIVVLKKLKPAEPATAPAAEGKAPEGKAAATAPDEPYKE